MKRYMVGLFAAVILMLSLSGCTPALHERLFVRAVGIDLVQDGYRVTVSAAPVQEGEGEKVYSAEGETVPRALERIAQETGQKPLYAHMSILAFGRGCAENGIEGCLDFFIRHYDSRPTVQLCVSETTAEELLQTKGGEERAKQLAELLEGQASAGHTEQADLIALLNKTRKQRCGTVLPVYQASETLSGDGAVILQDMRWAAVLDTEALRGYRILTADCAESEIVVWTAACGKTSLRTESAACNIAFTGTKESPRFEIEIQIKGEISALSNGLQLLERSAFSALEDAYGAAVLQLVESYLSAAIFESGTDAVGFLDRAQRDAAEELGEIEDPVAFLQNATFDIRVEAEIDRVEEENTPSF